VKKNARALILKTALDLIYRQGLNNTGISQIIEEAGVARASFYNNFKSKDDMVRACVREYSSQLLNLFGSLMKSSGSFTMFVEKWVSTLKSMDSAGVLNGCPMANIAFNIDTQDRHYSDAFNAAMGEWYTMLSEYFREMQDRGELDRSRDVNVLAKRIMTAYEGVLTMWRMTGDVSLFDDLVHIMPAMLNVSTGD
jgi:AcrR family transcriptional regulator